MPTAITAAVPDDPPYLPGETLTRRAVTVITALIASMAFAFSLGNITALALYLRIPAYIAWLIGPMVDLSVLGLLVGVRYLSLRGLTDEELRKPRRLLMFSGLLTLALNTAESIATGHYGTALVDATGPALLIGWGECGPWLLRQIYSVRRDFAPGLAAVAAVEAEPVIVTVAAAVVPETETAAITPAPSVDEASELQEAEAEQRQPSSWYAPTELLDQARTLDREHRAATGRPISRDTLRGELRISRDRASLLVTELRAEDASRIRHDRAPAELPGTPTPQLVGSAAA